MRAVTVDDQAIGRLIRQARKKKKVAIKDVAKAIVVSPAQMQKYEAGYNRITAANLVTIADFLELDVTELLGSGQAISSRARDLALAFDSIANSNTKDLVFKIMLVLANAGETAAGQNSPLQ